MYLYLHIIQYMKLKIALSVMNFLVSRGPGNDLWYQSNAIGSRHFSLEKNVRLFQQKIDSYLKWCFSFYFHTLQCNKVRTVDSCNCLHCCNCWQLIFCSRMFRAHKQTMVYSTPRLSDTQSRTPNSYFNWNSFCVCLK